MQKRRSIQIFLVLLAALLLIALLGPWKLLEGTGRGVVLKKAEQVDRIVLSDAFHNSELIRTQGSWRLFGTEEVSAVTVENLLFAASRLEVSSVSEPDVFDQPPVSAGEISEISFFKGERMLLSYRFTKHAGRYLLHPLGSEGAYYVSLPGYADLDLARVFSAAPDHYREHLLIDLRPSDIAGIGIELASGEAFAFTQDQEGNISCRISNEQTSMPPGEPRELAMKLLFSYFTSIRYEERTNIKADWLLADKKLKGWMASIELVSFSGEHHILQVFPYRNPADADPHLFKGLVLFNNEQDALLVNYIYLDVLMRDLSHYIGEK
jgi:hypothetical protein